MVGQRKRKIEGLIWVRADRLAPIIPRDRPGRNPLEKEGNDWEIFVGGLHTDFRRGIRLDYEDAHGVGWAFPDICMVTETFNLVIECKLHPNGHAFSDLDRLYLPLISALRPEVPTFGVSAVKYPKATFHYTNFEDVLTHLHERPTWVPTWPKA